MTAVRILEFAKGKEGDLLSTNRVQLDRPGPTYRMLLRWRPQMASWVLDMATTSGASIVSGAWLRDRTDCLLGISSPGRPAGAILPFDPKHRGDPGPLAFSHEGVLLLYVPGGVDLTDFLYDEAVG